MNENSIDIQLRTDRSTEFTITLFISFYICKTLNYKSRFDSPKDTEGIPWEAKVFLPNPTQKIDFILYPFQKTGACVRKTCAHSLEG